MPVDGIQHQPDWPTGTTIVLRRILSRDLFTAVAATVLRDSARTRNDSLRRFAQDMDPTKSAYRLPFLHIGSRWLDTCIALWVPSENERFNLTIPEHDTLLLYGRHQEWADLCVAFQIEINKTNRTIQKIICQLECFFTGARVADTVPIERAVVGEPGKSWKLEKSYRFFHANPHNEADRILLSYPRKQTQSATREFARLGEKIFAFLTHVSDALVNQTDSHPDRNLWAPKELATGWRSMRSDLPASIDINWRSIASSSPRKGPASPPRGPGPTPRQ